MSFFMCKFGHYIRLTSVENGTGRFPKARPIRGFPEPIRFRAQGQESALIGLAVLKEKGCGTPSGVGDRKSGGKARNGKGATKRSSDGDSDPEQENTDGEQSYVEVLTEGEQNEYEKGKAEGTEGQGERGVAR